MHPGMRVLLVDEWDADADPFTNAVRITVSALRKRLGEPSIIATRVSLTRYIRVSRFNLRLPAPPPDPGRNGHMPRSRAVSIALR
jgi:hypothetical protein